MAFIGIDRGIENHWIYQDAEYFKVWFEILLRTRFSKEPHDELVEGQIVTINYGEFIFGRIKWSKRLKISEQRLRTLIKKLKAENMIETVLEHRKCTIFRVVNYEKFNQQGNQQDDQSHQGINDISNQQNDQQATSKQPASNQQLTTKEQSKQGKQRNNVNKDKKHYAENITLTEVEYQNLCTKYGQDVTDKSIAYLSSYKLEKGYKTKSDNLTIQRWVVEAVNKNKVIQFKGGEPKDDGGYYKNASGDSEFDFNSIVRR